jgi:Uma2 family endonuclease
MVVMTALLSADEYLATPHDRPRWTELICGEVIVSSPSVRHQRITSRIQFLIQLWCEAEPGRGESPHTVDARLNDANVYAPDVWWVAEEHRPSRDAAYFTEPPDLVAEVRSPSTWRFDVGVKRATYERAGLPELWLVDTSSDTVLVFRRSTPDAPSFDIALEFGRGEVLTTPLLPGFSLPLDDLFDR